MISSNRCTDAVRSVTAALSPGIHEKLLIGCDCFLLQLSCAACAAHQLGDLGVGLTPFQIRLSKREESCKLSQVIASDCLHLVKSLFVHIWSLFPRQNIDQNIDALQILCLIEVDERCLPEFLGVHWRPCKTLSHYLSLPLFKGRELLIVHVEKFEEFFQNLDNVLIYPWTIL